jgi:hypothetical protein
VTVDEDGKETFKEVTKELKVELCFVNQLVPTFECYSDDYFVPDF